MSFFRQSVLYHIDEQNSLYVHGGFKVGVPIEEQDERYLTWDRDLIDYPQKIPQYKEVFVGHTSIWRDSTVPKKYGDTWGMDTGGGWEGKLSMMNIKTKEVFQSDRVRDLYPNERGR